jgi:hypothetical protein
LRRNKTASKKFADSFAKQHPTIRQVFLAIDDNEGRECWVCIEYPLNVTLTRMVVDDEDIGFQVTLELEEYLPAIGISVVYPE